MQSEKQKRKIQNTLRFPLLFCIFHFAFYVYVE